MKTVALAELDALTQADRETLVRASIAELSPQVTSRHVSIAVDEATLYFRAIFGKNTSLAVLVASADTIQETFEDRRALYQRSVHLRRTDHDETDIKTAVAVIRAQMAAVGGQDSGTLPDSHFTDGTNSHQFRPENMTYNTAGAIRVGDLIFSVASDSPGEDRPLAEAIALRSLIAVQEDLALPI